LSASFTGADDRIERGTIIFTGSSLTTFKLKATWLT